jgi:purine-binding chemotaxis protein CheW
MSIKDVEKQQVIIFKLDNRHYGASIEQIREITRIGEISPVPGAPSYVLGITNRRGQVTTIIDLRSKLGIAPKEIDMHSRMLVIETKSSSKGIVVDAVEDAIMLSKADIEETPAVAKATDDSANFIKGIGKKDQQLIVILDLKALTCEGEQDSDCVQMQANTEPLEAKVAQR